MAVVTVNAAPLIVTKPSFVLNPEENHTDASGTPTGADAVQTNCMMQDLDGTGDAELVDTDTSCDPNGRTYGQPSSEYVLAARYSPEMYGYLKQFERTRVGFAALNDYTAAVSATNREESGVVEFGQLPPEVHYKKNENRIITLTLPVVGGEATSTEVPGAAVFTHPLGV